MKVFLCYLLGFYIFFSNKKVKIFNMINYSMMENNIKKFFNSPFFILFGFILFLLMNNFLGFGWGSFFVWCCIYFCLLLWGLSFIILIQLNFFSYFNLKSKNVFILIFEYLTIMSRSISLTIRLTMNIFMGFTLVLMLHYINYYFSFSFIFYILMFFEMMIILLQCYILIFLSDLYLSG